MNVAAVTGAEITREGNGSFTARIRRSDGSQTALNSARHSYDAYDTASPSGRTAELAEMVRFDAGSVTIATGLADYDPNDLSDWMAGGYWLHIDADGAEIGAVVDGPELSRPAVQGIGSAKYKGVAGGVYVGVAGTDAPAAPEGAVEVGAYSGDFTATADFDRRTISGSVHNIRIEEAVRVLPNTAIQHFVSEPYGGARLVLQPADIDGDGRMTGSLTYIDPRYTGLRTQGSWGASLSSMPDGEGDPRLVAGTHAGTAETSGGSELTFTGAHYGATGDF